MRKARIKKEGSSYGKIVDVGKNKGRIYYCFFPGSAKAYQFWKDDLEFLNQEQ